jgi:hypothetical protein
MCLEFVFVVGRESWLVCWTVEVLLFFGRGWEVVLL